MQKTVYGLAGAWALLVVASFVAFEAGAPTGDELTRSLSRLSNFLTWQAAALVVAAMTALVARRAVVLGAVNVKLAGYGPLAVSVFLVVSLVGIIALRVLVQPLFA